MVLVILKQKKQEHNVYNINLLQHRIYNTFTPQIKESIEHIYRIYFPVKPYIKGICSVIGVSLSKPHSEGKSRTVVHAQKNDGEIWAAPHYYKFGTVVHVQKYTDKLH